MADSDDVAMTAALFSLKIHNDGIRNKLRTMINTEEKLQNKKELLLLKKKSLCKDQHVELQSTRSKLTTIHQKSFDQIFPLLSNIHRLQLHVLEMRERVDRSEVIKEKKGIKHAFSTACDQNKKCSASMLREWTKQMMHYSASDVHTNAPIEHDVLYFDVTNTPETPTRSSQRVSSPQTTLSFCTNHSGLSVKVDITATSLSSSAPAELEVQSSVYLEGLSEEVRTCVAEQRDSAYLVSSVIWRLLDQQVIKLL